MRRTFPDFLLVQAKISFEGDDDLITINVMAEPRNSPMTSNATGLNFIIPPNVQQMFNERLARPNECDQTVVANGAREENRTPDLRITSALLYRLSYPGNGWKSYRQLAV